MKDNMIQYSDIQLMSRFLGYLDKKVLIEVKPIDDWNSWTYSIHCEDLMSPFYEAHRCEDEFKSYLEGLNHAINYCLRNNY